MNERFSHHEPCPACGSKDNLGVWEDGHKFCFGCRYWEPPVDNIENIRKRTKMTEDNNNGDGFVFNPDDYTYALPDVAKAWLAKYGVTSTEIAHFNVCWNKMTDSLCFPVIINDKVAMTSERYFGDKDNHPKYIIKGEKNKSALFITHFRNKDMVVFVEDYVSAIKVARHTGACPLFGSTIPRNTLKWAVERFKTMRVWLDMDKAYQSVLEASKLSQYASDTRSIVTQLDPKEYTNQELINILSKYGAMGT